MRDIDRGSLRVTEGLEASGVGVLAAWGSEFGELGLGGRPRCSGSRVLGLGLRVSSVSFPSLPPSWISKP